MGHMNELSSLSNLFSDDTKLRTYFVAKIFPFSLKGAAKAWFNNVSPRSIDSPIALVNALFQKYFPASAQHAALQKIFDFEQVKGEKLPESWARFCSLIRALPGEPLPKNELLDIFYNGLTVESKTYFDSCVGCVFRKRTPAEAEELMAKISQNYDDWTMAEPTPAPTPKKRGMIELNDEVMREAKKSLKEKGIKYEYVKNLPPIEELCKPIPRSSTIEVYSLQRFDNRDIPYSKPPDQCLDEFDNFIVKQDNFNKRVQNHLLENSRAINKLQDIVERTSNDVKMLVKHFQMIQTQIDQLTKVQKDLLVNASREKHACEISTRSGAST
jgi:transcription termination factor NusB